MFNATATKSSTPRTGAFANDGKMSVATLVWKKLK